MQNLKPCKKRVDYSSLFLESNALKQQSVQINVSLGHYFPLKKGLLSREHRKLEVTSNFQILRGVQKGGNWFYL